MYNKGKRGGYGYRSDTVDYFLIVMIINFLLYLKHAISKLFLPFISAFQVAIAAFIAVVFTESAKDGAHLILIPMSFIFSLVFLIWITVFTIHKFLNKN